MRKNGRHIRSDKAAVIRNPDNQRVILLNRNQFLRFIQTHDAQGIGTLQGIDCSHHCVNYAAVVIMLSQLGYHFAVSLGNEIDTFLLQPFFDLQVVFDDPVVHNRDFVLAAQVRVGVDVRWFAVSGPPGVADTDCARNRLLVHQLLEGGQAAFLLYNTKALLIHHRNAGRIIPPVFQALQPIENDRHSAFVSHITNNAAHINPPQFLV